jgi:hypothetical protein
MATFEVDVGGVTYEVDAPDENTAWQWANQAHATSMQKNPQQQDIYDTAGGNAEQSTVMDLAKGALVGASDIGNTLINAATFIPRTLSNVAYKQQNPATVSDLISGKERVSPFEAWNREREAGLHDYVDENKGSGAFTVGRIGANIAGTAGVGGLLGKGVQAVSQAPKAMQLAKALETGGLVADGAGMATRAGAGAVTGAATAGLVNPEDAVEGGVVGAMLPVGVKLAGAIGRSIGGKARPEVTELARKAINEYDIPLGTADVSSNRLVKALRSVLNDAPLTGAIGSNQKEAVQRGFNRAVGQTFGANADSLTPEVMQKAKSSIGAKLNQVWGSNPLKVDGQFIDDLADISTQAKNKLNPEQAATVERHIRNLMERADNGAISGDFANNWQSELRQVIEGETGLQKTLLNNLRQKTLQAFKRNIPEEQAKLLGEATGQYKAYKTVSPLLNKAEAGVAGRASGDVPASLLPQQVFSSYGDNVASSPFSDLSQIGSQFVADRVPQTGGSPRALIQNTALGAALGSGAITNPMLAAPVIPSAMLLNKALGSPELAKQLVNMKPMLANSPEARAALIQALRAAPPVLTAQ